MKAKIKRIDKSLDVPKYQTGESAGFDFYCRENTKIGPKEIAVIPSNNIIEAPSGFFLAILPRSSTLKKTGLMLANSMGVVDRDYAGPKDEIGLLFYNVKDEETVIKKGARIAQGIFIKFDQVEWEEVEDVRKESRGGFGSTG